MRKFLCAILAVGLLATGAWAQVTITVPTDQPTVHAAVAAADPGDTVYVLNGTYALATTLNLAEGITLEGESESGVVFNVDCGSGYGIHPSVGGVTLKNFTLNVITGGTNAGFIIHASGTPNVQNGLTVQNVTIQGSGTVTNRRAGLDVHGYDNVVLDHVTSKDATFGNGFQITGCTNVSVQNCTTSNNAWGSLAVYCSSYLVPNRASDNVVIDGTTCSFGENNVFIENEYGLTSTNVSVTGYDYYLTNDEFRTGAEGFIFIKDTLADVQAQALHVPGGFVGFEHATAVQVIATGDFLVDASLGIGLTIQAAIDAAAPGDVINVGAGHFEEQLYIGTENLTVSGAGVGVTYIDAPDNMPLFYTTSGDNYPIVFVEGVNAFTMQDLTVDGLGRGNTNSRFQGVGFWNAGGTLTDLEVNNVMDTPFSGSQHGNGVYAYNNTGGPYTVTMTDVDVNDFQKTGVALNGAGLTVDLTRVSTPGQGPTGVTAQNGIQIAYGAGGTVTDCDISDIEWTGETWVASGILLYSPGAVTLDGVTVTNTQASVYDYDGGLVMTGCTVSGATTSHGVVISESTAKAGDERLRAPSPCLEDWDGAGKTAVTAVIDGCGVAGTGVAGTGAVVAFCDEALDITVTNTTMTGFDTGLALIETGGVITGSAHENTIFGNVSYGAELYTAGVFDASLNYWGGANPNDVIAFTAKAPPAVSPWYEELPGTVPMTWGTSTSINAVIALANPYDTINVAAGTYPESVTIAIPLTLNGANAGIHPAIGTHPTEVVGTRGAESILSNNFPAISPQADDITVDGFMFTGDGGRIVDTYADADNFHLTNCIFDNDTQATTQGVLQFGGGSHMDMTIDFNLFQDEGDHTIYTGGGPYDRMTIAWNRFNVMGDGLFWTATELVDGVIQGNELDGTIGGVPGVGYGTFNAGKLGNVQIKDNWAHDLVYTPFQVGIVGGSVTNNVIERIYPYPGYYGYCFQLWGGLWGTSVSENVLVQDNVFRFNDIPGATLPVHGWDITAPDSGVGVDGTTIVFRSNLFLDGGAMSGPLALRHRGDDTKFVDAVNNWWGASSGPYHASLNPTGTGSPVGDYVTFDPWLGLAGISASASETLINCGETSVVTVSFTPDTFTPAVRGFTITVDASAELSFAVGDIGDLDPFNGLGSFTIFETVDNLDGTVTVDCAVLGPTTGLTTAADLFTVEVSPVADGAGTLDLLDVIVRDLNNATISADVAGAAVTVDCTAPPAATNYAAAPGPDTVRLTWTMADASDVDHYELYRAVWHTGDNTTSAYPEYDDVNGPVLRQADYAGVTGSLEWTDTPIIVAGTATGFDLDDALPRGIYWYELFSVDEAGNVSPMTAEYVRATNYFLGDFDANGAVDGPADLSPFGAVYGNTWPVGTNYTVEAPFDIGPTDDFTGLGLPTTDNKVGFEDLMILALNYDTVAKQDAPATPAAVALNWIRLDDSTWSLELGEPCEGLLGLNVRAPLPEGVDVTVERGALLDQQSTPAFLAVAGEGLDIGLAALGQGFTGQGELLRVTAAGVEELSPAIDARGHDNASIDVALTATAVDLPTVLALNQNHPNPFNPSTTIKFDLPQRGRVDLKIYALDGSLVRTLVSEALDPGRHDVTWQGRDDSGRQAASGTYFYRLTADGKTLVRKMTLMK